MLLTAASTLVIPAASAQDRGPGAVTDAPAPAPDDGALALTVLRLVNQSRAALGRPAVRLQETISFRANTWAKALRRCQCLRHRNRPYGAVPGWEQVGESIGRSGNRGTVEQVYADFLLTAADRRNVLAARWTHVGIGVVRDGRGEHFVVLVAADYQR